MHHMQPLLHEDHPRTLHSIDTPSHPGIYICGCPTSLRQCMFTYQSHYFLQPFIREPLIIVMYMYCAARDHASVASIVGQHTYYIHNGEADSSALKTFYLRVIRTYYNSISRERDIATMKNIGQNLTLATSCMHAYITCNLVHTLIMVHMKGLVAF